MSLEKMKKHSLQCAPVVKKWAEVMAGSGGGSVCNGWRCTTGRIQQQLQLRASDRLHQVPMPGNLNELCGYA